MEKHTRKTLRYIIICINFLSRKVLSRNLLLKVNNVDANHLGVVEKEPTGVATILVESSTGQNKIVIVPGLKKNSFQMEIYPAYLDLKF